MTVNDDKEEKKKSNTQIFPALIRNANNTFSI